MTENRAVLFLFSIKDDDDERNLELKLNRTGDEFTKYMRLTHI